MVNLLKTRYLWIGALASLGALVAMPVALAESPEEQPTAEAELILEPATASPATRPSATVLSPSGSQVVDPNAGFGRTEASQGMFGEAGSPFDLIHRAVLANPTSLSDFSRQHNNRMLREAESFRLMQQEAIRNQATPDATGN